MLKPLKGIKVLDLTHALAGPLCTQILADYGAEVIKIENPQRGDETRTWGPPFVHSCLHKLRADDPSLVKSLESFKESAYFLCLNRNKQSMAIDLKHPEGQALVKELVTKWPVDVFIENWLPKKMDALGLGYEHLVAIKPDLIYASISGYGQTGPYDHAPAYDLIMEAEVGLMSIAKQGTKPGQGEDSPPVTSGLPISDILTGLYTHGAILAALHHKTNLKNERTRSPSTHINTSLFECQVASLANYAANHLLGGHDEETSFDGKGSSHEDGSSHPSLVPYQAFQAADKRWFVVAALNDSQFERLAKAVNMTSIEQYLTNELRVKHRAQLVQELRSLFKKHPMDHWLKTLRPAGVSCAPVNSLREAFAHPQIKARNMLQQVMHPILGKLTFVAPPVKFNESLENENPGTELLDDATSIDESVRSPPALGQDTDDILRNVLGKSESQLRKLRDLKVIR